MDGGLVAVVVRASVEKRAFKVEISSAGVEQWVLKFSVKIVRPPVYVGH